MMELDNIKMWESMMKYSTLPGNYHLERQIEQSLRDQGLHYNSDTKKIESIVPKPEYYKCIKEYRGFTVGKIYKTNEFGDLGGDDIKHNGVIVIENPYFMEWFRPAAPEEIPHEDYHWNGEIRVREVTGVLKKMIDNIDEEELAKTREEMLKESSDGELTEFENCMVEYYVTGTVPIEGDGGEELSKLTKEYSSKLLSIARKQIASEINVDEMVQKFKDGVEENPHGILACLTLRGAYKLGMNDTLEAIKENNYE